MKLLIADDHTLFRDALVQYIERSTPGVEVFLADDFNGALKIIEQGQDVDLVILDLRMPGMSGMNGFKVMKEKAPQVKVALMSGVAEERDVKEALSLGAVGYFPKTMSGRALLGAINQVLSGDIFVPQGKQGRIMPSYFADKNSGTEKLKSEYMFTPREEQVLGFLVDGASNKEIARALDLQVVTVKLHVRGICRKLDVANRTQAALKAKDLGVLAASSAAESV